MTKHVHVHIHRARTADNWDKWNAEHRKGQHAATAALHHSIAKRKGEKHPDHPHHLAAAKHHEEAAKHAAANKQAESEASHKIAKAHENKINKGHGSDPKGEVSRQNKAMSDPRVLKENRERMEALNEKHKKGAKGKAKDAAPCACMKH